MEFESDGFDLALLGWARGATSNISLGDAALTPLLPTDYGTSSSSDETVPPGNSLSRSDFDAAGKESGSSSPSAPSDSEASGLTLRMPWRGRPTHLSQDFQVPCGECEITLPSGDVVLAKVSPVQSGAAAKARRGSGGPKVYTAHHLKTADGDVPARTHLSLESDLAMAAFFVLQQHVLLATPLRIGKRYLYRSPAAYSLIFNRLHHAGLLIAPATSLLEVQLQTLKEPDTPQEDPDTDTEETDASHDASEPQRMRIPCCFMSYSKSTIKRRCPQHTLSCALSNFVTDQASASCRRCSGSLGKILSRVALDVDMGCQPCNAAKLASAPAELWMCPNPDCLSVYTRFQLRSGGPSALVNVLVEEAKEVWKLEDTEAAVVRFTATMSSKAKKPSSKARGKRAAKAKSPRTKSPEKGRKRAPKREFTATAEAGDADKLGAQRRRIAVTPGLQAQGGPAAAAAAVMMPSPLEHACQPLAPQLPPLSEMGPGTGVPAPPLVLPEPKVLFFNPSGGLSLEEELSNDLLLIPNEASEDDYSLEAMHQFFNGMGLQF